MTKMDSNRPTVTGNPSAPQHAASSPAGTPGQANVPKIQQSRPAVGSGGATGAKPTGPIADQAKPSLRPDDPSRPLPMAEPSSLAGGTGKITAFGKERRHEDSWKRTPNTTGNGAIHVKTFHCKLTEDAVAYMDQTINEWLDAHPQYEVKFVSSTIGVMTGKLKEPALFCQVWV
jgi:hypothetical protein